MGRTVIDLWNIRAYGYDRIRKVWPFNRILKREIDAIQLLLKQIDPAAGVVLDLGCGTGQMRSLLPLASKPVAMDQSRRMLCNCRKKPYLGYIEADALRLPFRQNSFDLVVSVGLVEYIRDIDALLQEIGYVLKHNGFLLLTLSPGNGFACLRKLTFTSLYVHSISKFKRHCSLNLLAQAQSFSQTALLLQKQTQFRQKKGF